MTSEEYQALLDELERRLERLRVRYEQWFQGLERLEPQRMRQDMERHARALRQSPPRNTALRFRQQTILQRLTTLSTYWDRVGREIEEGRYRRGNERARRRALPSERAPRPAEQELELELDADIDAEIVAALAALEERSSASPPPPPPAAARVPPPPPPAAARVPPRAAPPPPPRAPAAPPTRGRRGPTEARVDELFARFVAARRENNEPVAGLRREGLAATIDRMLPELEKKHAGKRIDFEVVIKQGRVGLRPVMKP